ncbi:peptidoglycan recognition protein family protein [Streptomyces sp. DH10]|uniref:peptidoglycan recognition protein family protein n=1 Tax=Streptomyces sp. DH10 TaxID=3040121 RepID=UPI002441EC15|nr:peptidoglycan recognition family protein [Streptomyces sp. DH10]MDG9711153.1 peptidoglycan recognition family protein [Streptomyces sp. DH10]
MKTVLARWFGAGRSVPIRVIVIHDMEAPEGPNTAENVAAYFSRLPASNKASAHVCVDNNSAVRCVADGDRAWHAPGANSDGLGLELAGYARQSRAEWLDDYSKGVIEQAAQVTADWCKKHNIPARKLSVAELRAGKRGIVGHVDVSKAYGQTNHYDPGPNFPWSYFISRVNAKLKKTTLPAPSTPPKVTKPAKSVSLAHIVRGAQRDPGLPQGVATYKAEGLTVEAALHAEGLLPARYVDGSLGTRFRTAYTEWQVKCGYPRHSKAADGIPGPDSLKKLAKKRGFKVTK